MISLKKVRQKLTSVSEKFRKNYKRLDDEICFLQRHTDKTVAKNVDVSNTQQPSFVATNRKSTTLKKQFQNTYNSPGDEVAICVVIGKKKLRNANIIVKL